MANENWKRKRIQEINERSKKDEELALNKLKDKEMED